jgi:hypothetical protein
VNTIGDVQFDCEYDIAISWLVNYKRKGHLATHPNPEAQRACNIELDKGDLLDSFPNPSKVDKHQRAKRTSGTI